jgi:hypothetical protein
MQSGHLFHRFSGAPSHRGDREVNSLSLSTRDRLLWSALSAAGVLSMVLSHEFRMFLLMLLRIAWLYMVAGARG